MKMSIIGFALLSTGLGIKFGIGVGLIAFGIGLILVNGAVQLKRDFYDVERVK
jgi:hypothetical protein